MRIISQWQRLVNLQIAIGLFVNGILANCPSVLAQIKPDNTLGQENSVINKVDNVKDLITGGASRGANLFHSFENFNVGAGRSVYFANPGGIENILTRVTGGNASNILGKLGVEGTANLFLINPQGIYFGKDASLDIKGSFIATTADEIQLGESGLFSATEPAKSNLLNVQPGALFANAIKNHQTKIENQANLITGKNLTFFSSNINSSGNLSAPHGQIELTATGNIQINQLTAQAARLTANQNINYGNISIVADDNTTNSSINPILSLTAGEQIIGTGNITTTVPGLLVKLQAEDNINIKNISSKGGSINIISENGDIITGILDTTYDIYQTTTIDIDEGRTFTNFGEFTFTSNLTDPIKEVKVRLSASNVISNSRITLSSHGLFVKLINSTENNLANFQDTLLIDSGSTPISSGSTPFNGIFQPDEPLAILNRRNPNGTWNLSIFSYENNNSTNTAPTVYKAGDIAPWGIATGTQLIITTSRSLSAGGNVNLKAGGKISTGDINSSSNINGGLINLKTNDNITTGNINSSSILGNGGNIALITNKGNLTTGYLDSSSFSDSGIAGNGGEMTLSAGGDITTQNLYSSSSSDSGTAGNGGRMTLSAGGDITTQNLNSSSSSDSGTAGNGGRMTLSAGGDISTQDLDSFSSSFSGTAGNGGGMTLAAGGDISTQYLNSYSGSAGTAGNGGGMTLTAGGDITTQNLYSSSFSFSGTAGNGGAMTLTAGGDISTQYLNSYSFSDSGTAGSGGAMALRAGGNISTQYLDSSSFSESGTAGNGGAMALRAGGNISTQDLFSYSLSYSESGTAGNGGAMALRAGGDISTQDLNSSSFSRKGTVGNGGAMTLTAGGEIKAIKNEFNNEFPVFSSFSVSQTGNSGQGGDVTLAAKNKITDLYILTLSSSDKSGDVQISSFGDLLIKNTNIITSRQLIIKNPLTQEEITLDVSGVGQSGNVKIDSTENLTFNNSRIESDTRSSNPAGNVTITSRGAITFNNKSKITSNTSSQGKAGSIQIDAKELNLTGGSEISASTTADGKAGDITLNAPTLTVSDGAKIFATTTGKGDGGKITINAPDKVNLGIGVQDSSPILSVETSGAGKIDDIIVNLPTLTVSDVLSVETSGAGKAGDIIVNTPTLTVSDTARITATATENATNTEGGGSITLNASKMNLAGVVGVFAETQGQAPAGTLKLNPYQNQPNLDITLFPNSEISASTAASGKGGDLILTAPENIHIAGKGKLAVESRGSGDAGNIQITAQNLTLSDGVQISASTSASGKSGSINLNIRDNITLTGKNTGLFANTRPGSTGDSGNITIDPQTFIIKNGAGIGVNSQGSGKGGNISIEAGNLNLDNGFITAETTSNQGGNINLNIQDLLLMGNNSRITASAGTNQTGGDGGNININSPLIVAMPDENNDITANAFQGKGGNINITANEIFGLEFRPQQTAKSDITASSELGVSGNVQINTPGVDPASGIGELPAILVDAESLVARNICDATVIRESSFVMTGKGGLPADSQDVIANAPGLVEWVSRGDNENKVSVVVKPQQQTNISQPINQKVIQQAQGWIVTANGQVILTADVPKTTLQKPHFIPPSCGGYSQQ